MVERDQGAGGAFQTDRERSIMVDGKGGSCASRVGWSAKASCGAWPSSTDRVSVVLSRSWVVRGF